jgi:hypothetical protein
VNTGKIQESHTELPIDKDLEIIKDNALPRLEKLMVEAIRVFNREE